MATFEEYVDEQHLELGQISENSVSEFLKAGKAHGQVLLDDGTFEMSPSAMAERYRDVQQYCARKFGEGPGNPANSLHILAWLLNHTDHCWLRGYLARGTACSTEA